MAILSGSKKTKTVKKKTIVTKKRSGVFDAIASLETQDDQAVRKQQKSTVKDIRHTNAAQSQVQIYQRLMEVRILLQRVMQTKQSQEEGSDKSLQQQLSQQLLSQLVAARSTLTGVGATQEADDSDNEEKDDSLQDNYQELKKEWKTVLNRRYKDLRLHAGLTAKAQFKLLDSDFYHQVEATTQYQLANSAKIAKQQQSDDDDDDDDDGNATLSPSFDDSKLYQHQLQDFLSMDKKRDTDGFDSKRRKKQNRKNSSVDRKASKGRKIRYHVHPKIVNFTFPLQRPVNKSTTMDPDEWFKSLFGGSKKSSKS